MCSQTGTTITTINFTTSSYSPKESPYLSAITPIPSVSQAQASTDLLFISTDFPILDISHKEKSHNMWSFVSGFLYLASFRGSSTFKHVSVLHCFLWGGLHVCIEHLLHFESMNSRPLPQPTGSGTDRKEGYEDSKTVWVCGSLHVLSSAP